MPYTKLTQGRFSSCGNIYHITTVTHLKKQYFSDFECARITIRSFLNATPSGAFWLCWVMMPDHFHGLLKLGETSLSDVLKSCKGRSSKVLNIHLKTNGSIWQKGFYDRAIRYDNDIVDVARYIVANPLRAGLVKSLRLYPYWDSVWI